MGNKPLQTKIAWNFQNYKQNKNVLPESILPININSFEFITIIGRGGFGKVWKVIEKKTSKLYAMKEMSKAKIIDKKSVASVKNERDFLSKINHPFIVNMHYAFQDNSHLYLVMDLLTGGDLRYQACKYRIFTEEQTKYFLACIILALEYCHNNNIIHRDIKPENLVLDKNGNVRLTDFGIAKYQHANNSKDTSGTPGYMSPEVLCGLDHTKTVDFFALGVIGYEFMKGVRPYVGNGRKEIKEKIMSRQAMIKTQDIPKGWTNTAVDCINRLIMRKPAKRLGNKGAEEVKKHLWFRDFKWKELYMGNLLAPFIPKNEDNFDYNYCNLTDKIGLKTQERYQEIIKKDNYLTLFEDYFYFNREDKHSNKYNRMDIEINDDNDEERVNKKFSNPHLIYEIEYDIEKERESRRICGNNTRIEGKGKKLLQSHSLGMFGKGFFNGIHNNNYTSITRPSTKK